MMQYFADQIKRFYFTIIGLTFVVVCFGQQSRGVEVEAMPAATDFKNTHALIVGISEYQSHPKIHNLRFADDDALAVATYLKSKAGGSVPQSRILELYNLKATSSAIMGAFRLLDGRIQDSPAEIKGGDRLIIYLSGHGGAFNVDDSYFFPTNADNAQDAGVAISIRTIKNYIENWRLKGIQVILIFDACRSATIGMGADGIRKVSEYLEAKRNGEILMVASSKGQEALEFDKIEHGLFTYYLLAGLYGMADKNGDGQIKGFEIASFLEENIATHSANKQFPFIDFNDYKSSTFAVVDPAAKAEIAKSFAGASQNALASVGAVEVVNATAGRGLAVNPAYSKLETSFQSAMESKNLLKPSNNNALFWFQQLVAADPKAEYLKERRLELASALLGAAQQVLLYDISGIRLYTRSHPGTVENRMQGYNLDYYADALLALQQYILLTNARLDDETQCLQAYLLARDLIIKGWSASARVVAGTKAQTIIEASLQRCSGKAFLYQALAQSVEMQGGNTNKFKESCMRAIRLAPTWSFPYNTLAQNYRIQSMMDSAVFYYNKAIKLNPLDVFPIEGLGHVFSNKGDKQRALGYYLQALQKDTLQVQNILNVGTAYYDLGKPEVGISYIRKAIKLDKNYSGPWYSLARHYGMIQKNDSSIYAHKQALRIDPDFYESNVDIVFPLINSGRASEGIAYALKAIEFLPEEPSGYNALGLCYQNQNLYDLAMDNFDKAIELRPEEKVFKTNRAFLLYLMTKYPETIDQLTAANANDAWGLQLKGECYMLAGNLDSAEKNLGESLKLNEFSSWPNYIMSRVKALKGQVPEAIHHLEVAIMYGLDRRLIAMTTEYSKIKDTREFRKSMKDRGIEGY